jgi:predicted MPP superfamily phosphohydrolase
LRRLFWQYFFRILLFAIAVAEWVCTTWLAHGLFGVTLPWWSHVVAPLGIYLVNTAVLRSAPPKAGWPLYLRRGYTAFAFSCVYGLLFLAILGVSASGLWHALALAGADIVRASYDEVVAAIGTGGLLAIGAAMLHGYTRGARRVWVNRIDVAMENLPAALDGLRVVQLSDIHLGPFMRGAAISAHVERVNRLRPDLIVLTGDITDGLDHAPETFRALAALRATHGVVAILGNHDVATGATAVKGALARYTDFAVLDDDLLEIFRGTSRIWIVGLMDRGLDWARGVRTCPILERLYTSVPRGEACVVLSHRPDLFPHAAELGCELVLSGHTHGGQLGLRWRPGGVATLARFMTRWPRGTYRIGRSLLHVNLGLGMTGQPVRVATPREITVLTLRRPCHLARPQLRRVA